MSGVPGETHPQSQKLGLLISCLHDKRAIRAGGTELKEEKGEQEGTDGRCKVEERSRGVRGGAGRASVRGEEAGTPGDP